MERAFAYGQGQPWLTNALAREIVVKMKVEPPAPITAEHVDEAKERLILARATHLDSLVAELYEPRVRRVIEPLIAGISWSTGATTTTTSSICGISGCWPPATRWPWPTRSTAR